MTSDRIGLIADALGRSPRTIVEIDEGYDFEVAIVDDEWVFRFPRQGPGALPGRPATTRQLTTTHKGFEKT